MRRKPLERFKLRHSDLKKQRETYMAVSENLAAQFLPTAGLWQSSPKSAKLSAGDNKYQNLNDGSGPQALSNLSAGLQSGLTNKSTEWFDLEPFATELRENKEVLIWLYNVQQVIMRIFEGSNFYQTLDSLYSEYGCFGTGNMHISSDARDVIRCNLMTFGEHCIAAGPDGRVDTSYRSYCMTVSQLVRKFGLRNCSNNVKQLYKNQVLDEYIDIVHAIEPNWAYDKTKIDNKSMRFSSVYYEEAGDNEKFLRVSGFDTFPNMVPRWKVVGNNVYGIPPTFNAVGDAKMLQVLKSDFAKASNKVVDPAMIASPDVKGASILNGSVTTVEENGFFKPAYQVNLDFNPIQAQIGESKQAIREYLFNDLFRMLQGNTKRMTTTEVLQLKQEAMAMLGSVIDRVQPELLEPAVMRAYELAEKAGRIPEPPEILQGVPIKIRFKGALTISKQSEEGQKASQLASFVGNLAQFNPEALDKVDFDKMIDLFGLSYGVNPELIRDDKEVGAIRQARAEQMQQQRDAELTAQSAQSAKTLSETQTGEGNLLEEMMGQ